MNATTGARTRGRDESEDNADVSYDDEPSRMSRQRGITYRSRRRTSGYASMNGSGLGDDGHGILRRSQVFGVVIDQEDGFCNSDDSEVQCSRDGRAQYDRRRLSQVTEKRPVMSAMRLSTGKINASIDSEERGIRRQRSDSRSGSKRRHHRRHGSPSADSRSSCRRHRIRLRTCDGTSSFETFWAHFENCTDYNPWKEADKLAHLKASLTGDAGQVLWDSDPTATDTLAKLTVLLRSRFSGARQAGKHRM